MPALPVICEVCHARDHPTRDGVCSPCREDPHLTEPRRGPLGWVATCSCGWTSIMAHKHREHVVVHGLLHRSIAHLYTR